MMTKEKNNEEVTSIRVKKKTRDRFFEYKDHYKENADDILNKLMFNYEKKQGKGRKPEYLDKV